MGRFLVPQHEPRRCAPLGHTPNPRAQRPTHMNKIRYGIIGCGSMGREHIENIKMIDGCEVTAIADDRRGQPRRRRRRCCPTPAQLFDNHRDLLASGLCDALVIATPNHTHARGAARRAGDRRCTSWSRSRCAPRIDDCLELVAGGQGRDEGHRLGGAGVPLHAAGGRDDPHGARRRASARVHQVAIREHREPFYPKVGDWNRFNANTGGTLVEKCCHYFNLMDLILQGAAGARCSPRAASASTTWTSPTAARTPDILDSAYVIVEYPSGARAIAGPVHVRRELGRQRTHHRSSATRASSSRCCRR